MILKIIFVICCITFSSAYWDVILDRCEVIEQDTKYADWSKFKVKKINKTTRALTGTIIYYTDIDDTFIFEAKLYKKAGNFLKLLIRIIIIFTLF